MNKHTPGPWLCIGITEPARPIRAIQILTAEEAREIATVKGAKAYNGIESYEERVANARLVAAAPELLAVLQRLVFIHENRTNFGFDNYDDCVLMAREAIAKAEGK